jgi:NAD(P)-dependent dehydrogenase (short-subunit alcohol dehydrogenase family)
MRLRIFQTMLLGASSIAARMAAIPERPAFHVPAIVYGASKAAVSMLTLQYAKALPDIKFNAVEPGHTVTDLGGGGSGGRPVEESTKVIVRMATIGTDGPTGTFQEDVGELAW